MTELGLIISQSTKAKLQLW